ncbi:MAG: TIR domain-containing protein [Pseudonocardia sp.]
MARLFDDLSMHVDQLLGSPNGVDPGFMDRSMEGRTKWTHEVLTVAGTCHVFILLISSSYVESKWCAMEWDASSPPRAGPSGVGRRAQFFLPQQLEDPNIAQRYLAEGVYGLLALNDEAAYQVVAWRLPARSWMLTMRAMSSR